MGHDRDEVTDLALKGAEMVAKAIGLTVPVAGAVAVLIEAVSDRRTRRQCQRLEKLVRSLIARLDHLEESPPEPFEPDLLDEILAKAVNDEDEDKVEYYAALIEYCACGTPNAYQVRLLGDAIKNLTAHEIKAFVHFNKQACLPHNIPADLRDIFWDRVCTLGLYPREKIRTDRPQEYATFLGKRFLEVCESATSARAKRG
jgi:hypothetical protein